MDRWMDAGAVTTSIALWSFMRLDCREHVITDSALASSLLRYLLHLRRCHGEVSAGRTDEPTNGRTDERTSTIMSSFSMSSLVQLGELQRVAADLFALMGDVEQRGEGVCGCGVGC